MGTWYQDREHQKGAPLLVSEHEQVVNSAVATVSKLFQRHFCSAKCCYSLAYIEILAYVTLTVNNIYPTDIAVPSLFIPYDSQNLYCKWYIQK